MAKFSNLHILFHLAHLLDRLELRIRLPYLPDIIFQTAIGADIIMQLDDVVDATHTDEERFQEARHRTVRWLDRCIVAHKNTQKQNLFPIVQGGLNEDLRR